MQRTRDLFICHAWRYHDDWNRLSGMLDAYDPYAWRNFSLPWFDPALNPATDSGGAILRWGLESQIIPVHAVILLSSVCAQQASRKWIDFEIEMARKHSKPILALPVWGETLVPQHVASQADLCPGWDVERLLALVDGLVTGTRRAQDVTQPAAGPASVQR
jgi:hypothetical protein